jgi:hypothetical protein
MPIAFTLAVALIVAGCCHNPHDHGGEFVVEHVPGESPETTHTPYKANYALYQWAKPPDGPPPQKWIPDHEVTELYVRGLSRWDDIGFEKGADGKLIAVCGSEKIPLEDGRYCWHITEGSEYRGGERILHEMGETVVTIALLPFAAVACVILLPIAALFGIGVLGVLAFALPAALFCH